MSGYGLGKWKRYYYRALTMFRRIHEYFVAFKWHIKEFSEGINYKSWENIFLKKIIGFWPFRHTAASLTGMIWVSMLCSGYTINNYTPGTWWLWRGRRVMSRRSPSCSRTWPAPASLSTSSLRLIQSSSTWAEDALTSVISQLTWTKVSWK